LGLKRRGASPCNRRGPTVCQLRKTSLPALHSANLETGAKPCGTRFSAILVNSAKLREKGSERTSNQEGGCSNHPGRARLLSGEHRWVLLSVRQIALRSARRSSRQAGHWSSATLNAWSPARVLPYRAHTRGSAAPRFIGVLPGGQLHRG